MNGEWNWDYVHVAGCMMQLPNNHVSVCQPGSASTFSTSLFTVKPILRAKSKEQRAKDF